MSRIVKQLLVSFFPKAVLFISMPLLVKILTTNLSVEHYGAYSLINSLGNYLLFVAGFGIHRYLAREIPGKDIRDQYVLFRKGIFAESCLFFLFAVSLTISAPYWMELLSLTIFQPVLIWFLWGTFFYLLFNETIRFLGLKKRLESKFILAALDKPLVIASIGIAFFFLKKIELHHVLICLISTYVVLFGLSLLFLRPTYLITSKTTGEKTNWNQLFFMLTPFFLIDLFIKTKDILPRYLLASFGGNELVGLFSFSDNFSRIFFLMANPFAYVMYPYLAASFNSAKSEPKDLQKEFKHLLKASFNLSCYFYMAVAVFGFFYKEPLILLLSKEAYLDATDPINLFLINYLVLTPVIILQPVLILVTSVKKLWHSYVTLLASNIAFSFFLSKYFLDTGAALSILFSNLLWLAFLIHRLLPYLKTFIAAKQLFHFIGFSLIAIGLVFAIQSLDLTLIYSISLSGIAVLSLFGLTRKKEILFLIQNRNL